MSITKEIDAKIKFNRFYNSFNDYDRFISHTKKKIFIDFIVFFVMSIIAIILYKSKFEVVLSIQNIFSSVSSIICLLLAIIFLILVIYHIYIDNKILPNIHLGKFYTLYKIYDNIFFFLKAIMIIIFTFIYIISPVRVTGPSMNNTLKDNDRGFVYHFIYNIKDDDIVVINSKDYLSDEILIIKRIVSTSQDEIMVDNDFNLIVNNQIVQKLSSQTQVNKVFTLDNHCYFEAFNQKIKLPDKTFIVLGDNRGNSTDSRVIGLVKEEDIIGKYVFTFFPFKAIGSPKKNLK